MGARSGRRSPISLTRNERFKMTVAETSTSIDISNILLATDFSETSEAALVYAGAVARQCGAVLHVAHVIAPDLLSLIAPNARASSLKEQWRQAETRMGDLRRADELFGTEYRPIISEGSVGAVLSNLVRERAIDLVVVGTRGHTGMKKLFLGSVAEEILGLVPCPLLTVGSKGPRQEPGVTQFHSIVAAIDFSAESMAAAKYAISLAQTLPASLALLHVVEMVTPRSADDKLRLEKPFLKKLRRLIQEGQQFPRRIECMVEFGDPSTVILNTVTDRQSDLIVVGARRAEAFAAHLPRSTAHRVTSEARCPVLTVRDFARRSNVGNW